MRRKKKQGHVNSDPGLRRSRDQKALVEKAQSHGRVDRAARTGQPGSAVSPGEAGGRAERREGQSGGEDAVREGQTCQGQGGAGQVGSQLTPLGTGTETDPAQGC